MGWVHSWKFNQDLTFCDLIGLFRETADQLLPLLTTPGAWSSAPVSILLPVWCCQDLSRPMLRYLPLLCIRGKRESSSLPLVLPSQFALDPFLCSSLPSCMSPLPQLSKAMLLQKSVAYVGRLQQERRQAQETAERLRSEIEELSAAIQ